MLTCPHCGERYPTPMNLTARQLAVYAFIVDYVSERGHAPSYEEIMIGAKVSGKSSVHRLLTGLEDRGAIKRIPYRARGIELAA